MERIVLHVMQIPVAFGAVEMESVRTAVISATLAHVLAIQLVMIRALQHMGVIASHAMLIMLAVGAVPVQRAHRVVPLVQADAPPIPRVQTRAIAITDRIALIAMLLQVAIGVPMRIDAPIHAPHAGLERAIPIPRVQIRAMLHTDQIA